MLPSAAADGGQQLVRRESHEAGGGKASISGLATREDDFLKRLLADPAWKESAPGRSDVITALAKSVTRRDVPAEMTELIDLTGEDWQEIAILAALPSTRSDAFGSFKAIEVAAPPPAIARLRASKNPKLVAGADKVLSPGESFITEFVIGLQSRRRFGFFVDVWGTPIL